MDCLVRNDPPSASLAHGVTYYNICTALHGCLILHTISTRMSAYLLFEPDVTYYWALRNLKH